ncbi:hypothetical protein SAMN06264867_1091, partial [Halorubrum cibi]
MESKHFLFVSADAALITDLAWQVHREGHDVKYYIALFCRRLLILLSCCCGVEEDKDTASAVSDTDD